MTFTGFPVAALDFYDDVEVDNTRAFWEKHKAVYAESVEAPMTALCAALVPDYKPIDRAARTAAGQCPAAALECG